ncbi:MAG: hypothetical protein HS108_10460 [Planctomycetes bacterium]|nr:hypothetical protein [Planctomycetota bacterium]MCL4730250.1 hypothetical protein [Planctomycetota bacterium]
MKHLVFVLALTLFALAFAPGCRETAEFFSFTGSPESNDGWLQDYEATPADTWEAFRLVALQNGRIEREDPKTMELWGLNIAPDSASTKGYNIRGRVYDRSKDGQVAARLIVHARYAKNADGGERQDIAKEYTNAVWRVLKQWKGGDEDPDKGRLDTTSEEAVKDDEAVAYFKLKPEQVFEAAEAVAKVYGEVEQSEKDKGFLRAVKKNPLEKSQDDVRISVFNRTEGDSPRAKISVRVRDGKENKPLQEIAKGYIAEIRKELEKRHGADAGKG